MRGSKTLICQYIKTKVEPRNASLDRSPETTAVEEASSMPYLLKRGSSQEELQYQNQIPDSDSGIFKSMTSSLAILYDIIEIFYREACNSFS